MAKQAPELAADFLTALRFCTRLPLPIFAFEETPHGPLTESAARMLPLAGALIGLAAAISLWLAAKLGLPAPLPALVALTVLVIITGAMHEDGLADCADGFFAGVTPDERLAIMKDSRLGTFGTLALIIALLLRLASLARLAEDDLGLGVAVLIATAATSRGFALLPLWSLPPARPQGASLAASNPVGGVILFAAVSAALVALLPLLAGASFGRILFAALASLAGAGLVTRLSRHAIAGQTGDVAGAAQQIAEICAYLAFVVR